MVRAYLSVLAHHQLFQLNCSLFIISYLICSKYEDCPDIVCFPGSFGISACCSLDRDLVVIASRGQVSAQLHAFCEALGCSFKLCANLTLCVLCSEYQAMSLSFNEAHGVVLWGSEASALNVPFAHGDVESPTGQPGSIQLVGFEDSEAAQPASGEKKHGSVLPKGASSRSHSCTHRYDLDEDGGEVVEVRVASCAATLSMAMAHWAASGNVRDIFSSTIGNMGG
jgi:hypothetical protein